jgi:Fe-S oxidoreductase
MEYCEPQIGRAAIKVLQSTGYSPIILKDKVDSGRPAISKGLLDLAANLAKHNLKLLRPYAKQRIPIVGCEPSVVAMLVEEYPSLFPGDIAESVSRLAVMFDDFLLREIAAGKINLEFDSKPRKVIFHGHCHQKAAFGIESTLEMLRLVPECEVEPIETGCCGMAGSFGYEMEHYDLSLKIADIGLAPRIREASPTTIICASGTSCREQILHTTGRVAVHPVEVVADALKESR